MNTRTPTLRTFFALGAILGMVAVLGSSKANADAAHSWKFGVYEGAGCDGVKGIAAFQKWSGKTPVGRALDFLPGYSKWSDMGNIAWWVGCWKGEDVIWSLPMLPNDGVSTLAKGAAGSYDVYFTKLAKDLVAGGFGKSVIRLGWEFNGNWYPWAAAKDPASFISYWHRIVTDMRAVPGAHFEFDWCAGAGWDPKPANTYYPGDAYVDIIGLDVYNAWWIPTEQTSAVTRWKDLVNAVYGLNWQSTFATQHKKQISFPEWGTGTRPDGHGGGDDLYFIQQMLAWQHESTNDNLNYADYWDYAASDYNAKLSDNHQPLSGVGFLQYWNWSPTALAAAKAKAAIVTATLK